MAALPYMQLYIADYLADTMHLDTEEHGAYLLLIFNYWQTGKPLPNDDKKLSRITRLSNDRWTTVKDSLQHFFNVTDLHWEHPRIEKDLDAVYEAQAQRSLAGKKSAEARKLKKEQAKQESVKESLTVVATVVEDSLQRNANEKATNKDTDTDTDINTYKNTCASDNAPLSDECRFEEFWSVYPAKKNKKKAKEIWKRKKLNSKADELIADVINRTNNDQGWLDGFIPHATTYFNGARWNDEIKSNTRQPKKPTSTGQGSSAFEKVLHGIQATHGETGDPETLAPDDPVIRSQVGEQLWGGSRSIGSVGSVIEGNFTRHDQTRF